jgi:hypothetical protein
MRVRGRFGDWLQVPQMLQLILRKEDTILAELDDLKKSFDDMTAAQQSAANELTVLVADIKALSATPIINPADVEALAVRGEAIAAALNSAVSAAQAAVAPPAPAPAPAAGPTAPPTS